MTSTGHGCGAHHADQCGDQSHAEILDLDAELLAEHTASITVWLPVKVSPRQILDLGCGTGTGTFTLLARFPEAHVTAVDSSVSHLHSVREKACEAEVADRVSLVQADLNMTWPALGEPDLVWASAALHHMADPDDTLRRVRDILAPGGLFAVVELAGFPRFLPDDAPTGQPGLEKRCHTAIDRRLAGQLPDRGTDWGPRLTAAGFTIEGERTITVNIEHSHCEAVGRYALHSLRSMRRTAAAALSVDDLIAMDQLLDIEGPHSILGRDDLAVRTERAVWVARRT
ncbi:MULTISPECIES: trans-aconitate 2-methyltransferase [unclassified Mycolicibacterium]|uniref:class I SAM-dependent methyltransferase n=1 Tax=unclassified Mycolicibacterium TaxID=2636767 RepID=UPI0012DDE12D|nr:MULTISPECIES: class I SAM-dependent methyltransferase [unclassified Mycolicibacterium]MUL82338.1 class I SAM-dependent methyltransferase [Mycolicibacterium sp. CBMA 329]MUL88104.1 class I SAM-dependent methyltransferase [Mycolicibacterium sp. CBMA 331]MUM02434.1 class I SAM-dependent methyltransferase [Mycolicibacterium sp. CBMA 334]MUM24837.1 class I SAM-dependent methyltransferase [Mycolicibacterium sp. CBMA 295]MUM38401.1 class I SAM-dependent methyltransferase [Mycolicibacterium sp. CBM